MITCTAVEPQTGVPGGRVAGAPLEIDPACGEAEARLGLSRMAAGLAGSEILRISADLRRMKARGLAVCDLTVGDFNPREFPIPPLLSEALTAAISRGETNYPPSDGLPELRSAIRDFYASRLGLRYPETGILVAGGARPILYAVYRAVLDPGETALFPVPSWNNAHYCHLAGARPLAVETSVKDRFQPTADLLAPHVREARLLVLNSPCNPTGTLLSRRAMEDLADLVLDENARRQAASERPLYVLFDQVYWMLTFDGHEHLTPVALRPRLAPFVLFADAISKSFCATGLRVGWATGPPTVIARLRDILAHVGAWAPRPEQVATGAFLRATEAVDRFVASLKDGVESRLRLLHGGIEALRAAGLPVRAIAPEGAIYLTVRFDVAGRRSPAGAVLRTNDDIRQWLLAEAGVGVVPFQAFGVPGDTGWFRLSVGAVSPGQVAGVLPGIEAAIRRLV